MEVDEVAEVKQEDFVEVKPSLYQRILSMDIGQTYLAVGFFKEKDGKYFLTNLGIHEFVKGSSPHQPIYFNSEQEAKAVNEYSKQKEIEEGKEDGVEEDGDNVHLEKEKERMAALSNRKKKQMKRSVEKITKETAPEKRPELPEMKLYESVAQIIQDYVKIWMPNILFIEDQLPEAKRNRMVQGAIAAACVALSIERVYVAPMSKFDFESLKMKELANKLLEKAIRMNSSPQLKIAALRLCKETIWSKEYHRAMKKSTNQDDLDDFGVIDRDSLCDVGNRALLKINRFYEKDLADAFLIGLRGVSFLRKMERENQKGVSN